MKEEYVEGILESSTFFEETVPEQLKGALGQAVNTMQQMPVPILDAISNGLTIPLTTHQLGGKGKKAKKGTKSSK